MSICSEHQIPQPDCPRCEAVLPEGFGLIDGMEHPHDAVARVNFNMGLEAAANLCESREAVINYGEASYAARAIRALKKK